MTEEQARRLNVQRKLQAAYTSVVYLQSELSEHVQDTLLEDAFINALYNIRIATEAALGLDPTSMDATQLIFDMSDRAKQELKKQGR